jgi:hypothetical protein
MRGSPLYCCQTVFASRSKTTRAVVRPVRSSMNSTGFRPSGDTMPRLVRRVVPRNARTPRPLEVSVIR